MRPIAPLTLVIHRTAAERTAARGTFSDPMCAHMRTYNLLFQGLPGRLVRSFGPSAATLPRLWPGLSARACPASGWDPRGASAIRSAPSIRRSPRWRHPSVFPSTGTGFNQWFCCAPRLIFVYGRSRVKLSARDSWDNPSSQRSSSSLSCDACSPCFRSCRISAQ